MAQGLPELRINARELLLLLLVLVFNLLLASYERRQGRRLNSPLLLADAHHTTSDIWTTVIVLVGLTGAWLFKISWLDVALAMPLAVLLTPRLLAGFTRQPSLACRSHRDCSRGH